MSKLSPAVQAVLDAYEKANDCYREEWGQLAAALRAAADQSAPEKQLKDIDYIHESYIYGMKDALACIEIIADELETWSTL